VYESLCPGKYFLHPLEPTAAICNHMTRIIDFSPLVFRRPVFKRGLSKVTKGPIRALALIDLLTCRKTTFYYFTAFCYRCLWMYFVIRMVLRPKVEDRVLRDEHGRKCLPLLHPGGHYWVLGCHRLPCRRMVLLYCCGMKIDDIKIVTTFYYTF
jgi:hypothetical protein